MPKSTFTKEQLTALKTVYDRDRTVASSYRAFRRTARRAYGDGVLMVHWKGMWLGIEPDGYTHS